MTLSLALFGAALVTSLLGILSLPDVMPACLWTLLGLICFMCAYGYEDYRQEKEKAKR